MKTRIWMILEGQGEDRVTRFFQRGITALILLNFVALVLESDADIRVLFKQPFAVFEMLSIAIFTLEYLARIWSCTEDSRYRQPFRGRLRFGFTPMALLDLLTIFPFYISLASDTRSLRLFRLFRVLRILKLARYSNALNLFAQTFSKKRDELMVGLVIMLGLLCVTSSLMYFVENPAQPEQFSSIPAAMWWSVATLTTVGYGDIYPITAMGRLLGAVSAIFGVGLFALPAGVLVSGFMDQGEQKNELEPDSRSGEPTPPFIQLWLEQRGEVRIVQQDEQIVAMALKQGKVVWEGQAVPDTSRAVVSLEQTIRRQLGKTVEAQFSPRL